MADVTTSAGATESALFQCGSCKRQYKRLDHLARHVRSHTQTKPYSCRICGKAFARADILKRHMAGHEGQGSSRRRMSQSISNDAGRVTQACRACSTQHLRCAEEKPCRRCVNKGIECQWNQVVEPTLTPPYSAVSQTADDPFDGVQQHDHDHDHDSIQVGVSVNTAHTAQSHVPTPTLHHLPNIHVDPMNPHDVDPTPGFFPDWNLLPGQWTPMGTSHFELAPNLDLDDIDLRFLDSYNLRIPFELGRDTLPDAPALQAEDPSSSSADPCHAAALCTEAFKNSHWRFRPNPHDNGGAEEHNLSLPGTNTDDHHSALESRILLDRRVTCARLGVSTRDKILTMIVESCRPANLARAVASFPSVELLDSLLQYSLASPVARYDEFLHTASFNPNEQRVELVAAMAAAGAVLTADPALTKLGYAIQECLRVAVPKQWESDNTLIRDLQLVQAFLITLDIGLWSGHGRKVEIAESFLQPLLTMLRRGGKLRRSGYPKIILQPGEEPDAAARTWHAWVQQESFKRVALRVIQHDAEASMALLVNPLVSYAEAQLPLPSPERLWRAGSASQWAGEYLSHEGGHAAVTDLLDDPEKLHIHRDVIDAQLASYAFLSCLWRLSWEYIQLDSIRRAHPRQWNALVLASRHDELLRLASRFRVSLDMNIPCAQDLLMKLNVTLLHLHMPFEEIQLFAGMEGPEQARIVYPAVLEWVKGEAARQAVWFAGQIVRSARVLPRTAIQRGSAVMVYHACIALWVYGMLGEGAEVGGGNGGMEPGAGGSGEAAYLDDVESIALQRFTQVGRGYPCIRGLSGGGTHFDDSADVVYLCHPHRVIEVIIGILRGNHDGQTLPRLVDQLIQLMTGLQKASRRGVEG